MRSRLTGVLTRFRSERVLLSLVAAQLITAAGAFIVNIIIARSLGPGARGEIALTLQLVYAGVALASLGRPQAILVSLSSQRSPLVAAWRLIRSPLLIAVLISIGAGAALRTSVEPPILIVALACQVSGGLAAAFIRAVSILTQKPIAYLTIIAASQTFLLGGGALVLLSQVGSVVMWLLIYSVGSLPPAIIGFLVGLRTQPRVQPVSDTEVATTSHYGREVFPAFFFEHISGRLDKLLIPFLAGYAQLGLYAVVTAALEVVLWPLKQFADSRIGPWARSYEKGALEVKRVLIRLCLAFVVLGSAASIALWYLLVPVFGTPYEPAKSLVPVVAVATTLRGQAMILAAMGLATGRPRVGNVLNIGATTVALVAYLLLIPLWGAFGAATASCLGYLAGFAAVAATWNRKRADGV